MVAETTFSLRAGRGPLRQSVSMWEPQRAVPCACCSRSIVTHLFPSSPTPVPRVWVPGPQGHPTALGCATTLPELQSSGPAGRCQGPQPQDAHTPGPQAEGHMVPFSPSAPLATWALCKLSLGPQSHWECGWSKAHAPQGARHRT